MKWDEHLDFRNSRLKVRGTWRRSENRFVDYPKGKKWFDVKIPPELLAKLRVAKLGSSCEYVITAVKDKKICLLPNLLWPSNKDTAKKLVLILKLLLMV